MLNNYLKIALRNLWKHKLFSFINVFGLASGLTVCMLAIAHIKGAFDYDSFQANRNRTYRIISDVVSRNNDKAPFATTPVPLGATLKQQYGFIEEATHVVRSYNEFLGNHKRLSTMGFAVDPGFFHIFSFPLAQGRPATEPNTVVLTQAMARKFFGTANPIGQTLQHQELGNFTVTGVLAELPAKSHLVFDLLFSSSSYGAKNRGSLSEWKQYNSGYTYVMLKPGTPADALDNVLPLVVSRATRELRFADIKGYTFRTQQLSRLSPARSEMMYGTYEPQVPGLLAELGVGLITLLLAAFNYVNLTLARSLSRAREVGIRKVSGAVRWQLLGQFMAESVVLSLLALGLAFLMLELVKPMAFVQQWLIGGVRWDWTIWVIFALFSIAAGLLAGIVPARVLSGFEPAQVLRSHSGLRIIRGISLRKTLIVIQFTISLVAMISLLTMVRQMDYMATGDYGFRRERMLNVPINDVPAPRLMNELNRLTGVERISATSELFGSHGNSQTIKRTRTAQDSSMTFLWSVNDQFVPNMGLTLLAGQNMAATAADTVGRQVLINEEAVKAFGLGTPRDAIGQSLWLNDSTDVQVVGVLKDFRFTTFAIALKPLILHNVPNQYRYVTLSVAAGAEEKVMADVKQVWKRLRPYEPFEGQWYDNFLEDRHTHADDADFMGLLIGLAFSIGCLGLLGMVTYTTQTRVKEIGVRKVMGAEVSQLVWLLSRDFVKLLVIAAAIALPLGYMAGYAFLFSFAYHVAIGAETLGLCVGVLLVLGSLTIGLRTYLAARSNPVNSLRTE
ncbi:ABC transporter permease [Fibrivirga algicola]|uniref:FtsX-like permease family protein n=1 Tax=Fibrivirga algicola TaxID=2950420 RepID=A0ABX0QGW7_9BACT|nr:ABC transporter permease [Fibrivirga algicola]NID10455.1 FtsX-like permease family protein [Fibrivirga algicola]